MCWYLSVLVPHPQKNDTIGGGFNPFGSIEINRKSSVKPPPTRKKQKKKNEALRIAETNPYLSILAKVTFLGMVNSDSFTAEKSPGTWKTVTVNVAPPLETPGRWYTIST